MDKEVERKPSKRWGLWTWSEDEKDWDDWRNDPRWNSSSDWNECASEEAWEKRRALSRGIPQAPFPRMSGNDAPQRRLVNLSGKSIAVTTAGSGAPTVVFEAGLGASGIEWAAIQEEVAGFASTFSYDRAGYGLSTPATSPRTPMAVVDDLLKLINTLELPRPYVLVAHSQGGLYARLLAATRPDWVTGVVLLDPLSPDDSRFRSLPPRLLAGSGADKLGMMRTFRRLGRLRLLSTLRHWLIQGPPFYYYRGLNKATLDKLWSHHIRREMHDAAIDEYVQAHEEKNLYPFRNEGAKIRCPVRVLSHDPGVMIADIVEYGGLTEAEASQVEQLWQELLREPADSSVDGQFTIAEGSGHYIQFGRPDLVLLAIRELVMRSRPHQ